VLVANSQYVASRIRRIYGRTASVVYPPVDIELFTPRVEPQGRAERESFYVTHGRLVDYKRLDLIVEAFRRMGKTLLVIGDGPERGRLEALAGPTVRFLGYQPGAAVASYLHRARGYVIAALEDFGIAPVEAQASGCPVIAYGRGGVRETVREGETGIFFEEQTTEALIDAILRFEAVRETFDSRVMRANAQRFGGERFMRDFANVLASLAGQGHECAASPGEESAAACAPRQGPRSDTPEPGAQGADGQT
jgi:glycosyltransferase involved in cell wall biosynthesis